MSFLRRCKHHGLAPFRMLYNRHNTDNEKLRVTYKCRLCDAFTDAKYRAKKRKIPFTLSRFDLNKIVEMHEHRCAICGDQIDIWENGSGSGFGLSWDQRIPGAGYTAENVQPTHIRCNVLKMDLGEKDLSVLCKKIYMYQQQKAADSTEMSTVKKYYDFRELVRALSRMEKTDPKYFATILLNFDILFDDRNIRDKHKLILYADCLCKHINIPDELKIKLNNWIRENEV